MKKVYFNNWQIKKPHFNEDSERIDIDAHIKKSYNVTLMVCVYWHTGIDIGNVLIDQEIHGSVHCVCL